MILHTRPLHVEDVFIDYFKENAIAFTHAPFFEYEYLIDRVDVDDPAILITSKVSATLIPEQYTGLIFCVGPASHSALVARGFKNIICPNGGDIGVASILKKIKNMRLRSLTYVRGQEVKYDIPNFLDITINERIVYRKKWILPLPSLVGVKVVTFFSQKAYDFFIENFSQRDHLINIKAFCFGKNFTQKNVALWGHVIVGTTPNELFDK
jgi:uroporphyrinogen-III synthase